MPVCMSVCISSSVMPPRFSELRASGRNCSTARVWARLRISSCSSVGAKLSISLYPFDNHAVCHTPAFTHGLKAVATTSTLQFVQEDGGKTRAGSSQWMAYGNCPAVDVDPLHVRAGLTLPGQHHTGECFINLDQIHLVQCEASPLQHFKRGGSGRSHDHGGAFACPGKTNKTPAGPPATLPSGLPCQRQPC